MNPIIFVHLTEVIIVPRRFTEDGQPDVDEDGFYDVEFENHLIRVRVDEIVEYSPTRDTPGFREKGANTHVKTKYRDIYVMDTAENLDEILTNL